MLQTSYELLAQRKLNLKMHPDRKIQSKSGRFCIMFTSLNVHKCSLLNKQTCKNKGNAFVVWRIRMGNFHKYEIKGINFRQKNETFLDYIRFSEKSKNLMFPSFQENVLN